MPDDLKGGNLSESEDSKGLSDKASAFGTKDQGSPPLAGPQERSPLEESSGSEDLTAGNDSFTSSAELAKQPDSTTNSPLGTPAPTSNAPKEAAIPDEAKETTLSDPAAAPDTDEFLKSILNDDNKPPASASASSPAPEPAGVPAEAPPSPGALPPAELPAPDEPVLPEPKPPELPEPVPNPLDSSPEPEKPAEPTPFQEPAPDNAADMPAVKDASADAAALPYQGPQEKPPEGRGVSQDLISSMQKPPPPKGNSRKVLSIVAIVVIVGLAGYSIYSIFFAKSTQPPVITAGSATAVSGQLATEVATTAATNDEQRKNDLFQIQQALINYSANNNGKYPISAEMISLNTPGNILEKELVPKYLSRLPVDLDASKYYAYKSPDGINFELTAVLDNTADPEATVASGKAIFAVTAQTTPTVSSITGTVPANQAETSATVTPASSNSIGF